MGCPGRECICSTPQIGQQWGWHGAGGSVPSQLKRGDPLVRALALLPCAGSCGSEHAHGAGRQDTGTPSSRPCPFLQAVNHACSTHERPVYALPAQGVCLVPTILLLEGSRGCGNTAAPCAWPQRLPPLPLRWHLRPAGVRAAPRLLGGLESRGLFPHGSFSWLPLNGSCLGHKLSAPHMCMGLKG